MVKDEQEEVPPRMRHHGGGSIVVIHERRHLSPPRQLHPVKREWTLPPEYKAVASIIKAEDDPEEFSGLRRA